MLQARRSTVSTEEGAPVGDVILSRLYRAATHEIADIVLAIPDEVRAQLAGFCYARAHLRSIGREIGVHCDDAMLMSHAGAALGRSLIAAKRQAQNDSFGTSSHSMRPKVTLASAADMRRKAIDAGEPSDAEHADMFA